MKEHANGLYGPTSFIIAKYRRNIKPSPDEAYDVSNECQRTKVSASYRRVGQRKLQQEADPILILRIHHSRAKPSAT
jgi:hypothetical protein